MSETELSFAQRLLAKEHLASNERHKDREPDPKLTELLRESIKDVVKMSTDTIPIVDPQVTLEHEGTIGFLPPGAKKEVGRAMMRGHEPPPVRLIEEVVSSDLPERRVDALTLHLIHGVDPQISGSSTLQETMYDTFAAIKVLLADNGEEKIPGSSPEDPPIHIKEKHVTLHLIKKDVAGHYMIEPVSIRSRADIDAAIERYRNSLDWVLKKHPEARLGSSGLDTTIIGYKLDADIQRETDPTHLAIPVGIEPVGITFIMPPGTKLISIRSDKTPSVIQIPK